MIPQTRNNRLYTWITTVGRGLFTKPTREWTISRAAAVWTTATVPPTTSYVVVILL